METTTLAQYNQVITKAQWIFEQKNKDYHTSWRILRLPSFTDQLMIKAKRIRNIQEKMTQQVADDVGTELVGIINYSLLALIQIELADDPRIELPYEEVKVQYDKAIDRIKGLLAKKNHDYDEVWRDMRVSSIVDIILMKLLRIKKIEDNEGATTISEGVKAGYQDIVNYAVFAAILEGYHLVGDDA